MMKASIPLLKPDGKPVGTMDEAGLDSAQKLLLGAGFQKEPVNVAEVFTAKSTP